MLPSIYSSIISSIIYFWFFIQVWIWNFWQNGKNNRLTLESSISRIRSNSELLVAMFWERCIVKKDILQFLQFLNFSKVVFLNAKLLFLRKLMYFLLKVLSPSWFSLRIFLKVIISGPNNKNTSFTSLINAYIQTYFSSCQNIQ